MRWSETFEGPEATQAFAARLGQGLASAAAEAPGIFLALSGDLGAGKTTFVQGLVAALEGGQTLYVTSPTYALAQTYETDPPVTHMDLYRLGSFEDLEGIGYEELYYGRGLTVVEWADRVPEALPAARIDVQIASLGPTTREVSLVVHGAELQQLLRSLLA